MEAMTKESSEQAILLLLDELLDDLLMTSDEEVVAEAIEDYGSAAAALGNIRDEIEAAINSLGKDRLAEARAAVAFHSRSDFGERGFVSIECLNRVKELLSSDQGNLRLTLAARNGREQSNNDVLSALTDLCDLKGEFGKSLRAHNFGSLPKAERILRELGVTEPKEIDVEAIAWHLGARVRYDHLNQCEARIVGADDAAIITVNKTSSPQRQRFSICHELGHWIYHRRRMLLCQSEEIERPTSGSLNMERIADRFASELLMPTYLFVPIAKCLGQPNMHVVRRLSEIFNTSQTATAIRLVEISETPLILVCHGRSGRRWFARSQTVTSDWVPHKDLVPENSAFTMIFGRAPNIMPPKSVNASKWFNRGDASRFEVVEESFRTGPHEVMTLLAFKDQLGFLRHSRLHGH
jgi:Zn-dependent peptidase ImmA (M78 family)